jgi:ABC-2 type transport system permease protein
VNDLGIVLSTELLRKLRSRIFWIATAGGVLVIALLVEAPFFFARLAHTSNSDIVLAGPPVLRDPAAHLLERRKNFRIVARVDALPVHVTPEYLDQHGHAGAAVAVSIVRGRLHVDVYPRDLSAFDAENFGSLVPLAVSIATGLPVQRIERVAAVAHTAHPIDRKFKDSRAATVAHGIAFGLVLMLYLAIILGSQSVMSAVAEEKTSRIAEILIATIAPSTLLYGKTIAAAIVALVQVGLWIVTAAALVPQATRSFVQVSGAAAPAANAGGAPMIFAFDPWLLAAFLTFFILGYLQYAAIYAAAASLVSRTEELGSVTTPVIMPVVGAFFIAQYALLEPTAPLVTICSFVPFLSPFVAFTRIAVTSVPGWQVAVAVLVNVATVAACFWVAGRVYRIGMLLYGKPPSLPQIFAALRE